VDLRIGVVNVARELTVELAEDTDSDALRDDIEAALMSEGVLWITDRHGKRVGVPVDKVAYVEVGSGDNRRIGFATS
jgi:Protein of unknown function (DUF3107)